MNARVCSDPHVQGCGTILSRYNHDEVCAPCWARIPLGLRERPSTGEHRTVPVACATCGKVRRVGVRTVTRHGGADTWAARHPCIVVGTAIPCGRSREAS